MRRWNRFRGPGSVRAAVRRPSIEPEWLTDAVAGRLGVPGLAEARDDEEIVAACAAAARGLAASLDVPLSGSDPRTPADLARRFYDFSPPVRDYAGAAVEELLEYFPEMEGDIRVDCVKPVMQDLGGGPDIFRLLGNGARDGGIALLQGKAPSGGWRALRDAWVPAGHCPDRSLLYPLVPIVFEYPLRGRPPAAVARRFEISSAALADSGPAPLLSGEESRLPRHMVAEPDLFDGASGKAAGRWMGKADEGRRRRARANRLFRESICKPTVTERVGKRSFEVSVGELADWAIGPSYRCSGSVAAAPGSAGVSPARARSAR